MPGSRPNSLYVFRSTLSRGVAVIPTSNESK